MRKISFFISCICFVTGLFAEPIISIEEKGPNVLILTVTIDNLKEKILTEEGTGYHFIGLDEFGYTSKIGSPKLPGRAITLLTSENPDFKIEILQQETEIRKGYNLYPVQEPRAAVTGVEKVYTFQKNSEVYNTNKFYPEQPVEYSKTFTFKGVPLSLISVSPVQYNPKTGELKIYRKLKVKVKFDAVSSKRTETLNSKSYSLLSVCPKSIYLQSFRYSFRPESSFLCVKRAWIPA